MALYLKKFASNLQTARQTKVPILKLKKKHWPLTLSTHWQTELVLFKFIK